jgi:putative salt-induced outer membrane protein
MGELSCQHALTPLKRALFQQPASMARLRTQLLGIVVLTLCAIPTLARAADPPPAFGWDGEIALGGSIATGNTDRQALDLEAKAQHRTERREDRFRVLGDLARENGEITSERTEVGVQTNFDIAKDKFYLIGFTQARRDKFSGFIYEIEAGPGVGYRFVRTDRLTFAVEFSTGYRHGEVRGGGNDEDLIFARGTATLEYQLSDSAKLANDLLIAGDNQRVKVENTLSVTSTLIRDIAMRVSINARYNTDPPRLNIKRLDTISKIALVYAF